MRLLPEEVNYVITHGNCPDGWGAAWTVWRDNPNCEYFFAHYGSDKIPEVEGKNVLMVDFAYKEPEFMNELAKKANKFLLLDHHKTAVENLYGKIEFDHEFDMKRSGARMAWDFMNPGKDPPFLIQCIEDRDLWNWKIPNSKEFLAAMDSYELSFENLEWISNLEQFNLLSQTNLAEFIMEGMAIRRFQKKLVEVSAKRAVPTEIVCPDGSKVNAVTVNDSCRIIVSDVCHHLVRTNIHNFDIAAAWWTDLRTGMTFVSMRSEGETDVAAIAKLFGGGGHKNAAGFEIQNPKEVFFPIIIEDSIIGS